MDLFFEELVSLYSFRVLRQWSLEFIDKGHRLPVTETVCGNSCVHSHNTFAVLI